MSLSHSSFGAFAVKSRFTRALGEIRYGQLVMIEDALRITQRGGGGVGVSASEMGLARALRNLPCR